jgi:hypothetical protein
MEQTLRHPPFPPLVWDEDGSYWRGPFDLPWYQGDGTSELILMPDTDPPEGDPSAPVARPGPPRWRRTSGSSPGASRSAATSSTGSALAGHRVPLGLRFHTDSGGPSFDPDDGCSSCTRGLRSGQAGYARQLRRLADEVAADAGDVGSAEVVVLREGSDDGDHFYTLGVRFTSADDPEHAYQADYDEGEGRVHGDQRSGPGPIAAQRRPVGGTPHRLLVRSGGVRWLPCDWKGRTVGWTSTGSSG